MNIMVTNIITTQHSLPAETLETYFLLRAAKQKLQLFFFFLNTAPFLVPSVCAECMLAGSCKETCPFPTGWNCQSQKDLGAFLLARVNAVAAGRLCSPQPNGALRAVESSPHCLQTHTNAPVPHAPASEQAVGFPHCRTRATTSVGGCTVPCTQLSSSPSLWGCF